MVTLNSDVVMDTPVEPFAGLGLVIVGGLLTGALIVVNV
jgi:hypothetical protein